MPLRAPGEQREVKVDRPGIVRLGCNIHAAMAGYIVVVDAPHYVVVDRTGTFTFWRLAAGKYKVRAWAELSTEPLNTVLERARGENRRTFDLEGGIVDLGPGPDKLGRERR